MPEDLVTLREDVVEKTARGGGHDMVVLTKHEAPSDPDGGAAYDPFQKMDIANASWMMDVLQRAYPGHPWRTVHDGHHEMAYVSIPILMGINRYWAINLRSDELSAALIIRCGGAILERYGLSRQRFNLGAFLEARQKHSALVVPSRKVPE